MNNLKTLDETLDENIVDRLNESVLPGEFEGMYFQKGKDLYQVKKTGNRYFYYSRKNAAWMPLKKVEVKFTDNTWDDLVKELDRLGK